MEIGASATLDATEREADERPACGALFTLFPNIVLESLLTDVIATSRRNGVGGDLVIEVTRAVPVAVGNEGSDGHRITEVCNRTRGLAC